MMMNNLFSIFDPSCSTFSFNWAMAILPFLTMSTKKNFHKKLKLSCEKMISTMKKEIYPLLQFKSQTNIKMFVSIMITLMIVNILSLTPYNFTITSQIAFNFPMAISLWLSLIIMGWLKNSKHMMTHLLPLGTPNMLMMVMIMIEMISQLIRPITLSIRLTANMVAGHLLLSLLGNLTIANKTNSFTLIPVSMMMTMLEACVAIIQGYVFCMLITLYSTEIN